MPGVYDIGEKVIVTATLDEAPALEDVTVMVRAPSGETSEPEPYVLEGEDVGEDEHIVAADIFPTEPGDWWYEFNIGGESAEQGVFTVRRQYVLEPGLEPYALTTVERCRSTLKLPAGADTDSLIDAINAYSETILRITGRQFLPLVPGPDGEDPEGLHTYEFVYYGHGLLEFADDHQGYEARHIETITLRHGLVEWELDPTEYRLDPLNRSPEGTYLRAVLPRNDTRMVQPVAWSWRGPVIAAVEGRWGAGFVPPTLEKACRIAVGNDYRNPEGFQNRQLGEGAFSDFDETGDDLRSIPLRSLRLIRPFTRDRAWQGGFVFA